MANFPIRSGINLVSEQKDSVPMSFRGRRGRRGGRGTFNDDDPVIQERDLRDVEIEELRRQVQQLQEHLARFDTREQEDSQHDLEGEESTEEDDVNPFHRRRNNLSSEDERPRRPRRNEDYYQQQRGPDVKVDIPEFGGKMHTEEFIGWLHTVERVFDYKDLADDRKVKLVAIKLTKHASNWWEHLKKQRAREGKKRIKTWAKMKKELKKKFLPQHYLQDSFLEFHDFKQRNLSVEEFTAQFDNLRMLCDLDEPEEQTIARYLGGLRTEIANTVQLQQYWSFNDVVKLSLKVENN